MELKTYFNVISLLAFLSPSLSLSLLFFHYLSGIVNILEPQGP